MIMRKTEAELQSSGCWSRMKICLHVSITEQRREICPVEILNIFLCKTLTFSPPHRVSAALRGHAQLKWWRETDSQRERMMGWVEMYRVPAFPAHTGRIAASEVTALQPPAGQQGDKITAQEALTQHQPTCSACTDGAKRWLLFHVLGESWERRDTQTEEVYRLRQQKKYKNDKKLFKSYPTLSPLLLKFCSAPKKCYFYLHNFILCCNV